MVFNRRERMLLAAVLTIAGGYGSFVFVQKALLNRLDDQHAQIRRVTSEIAGSKRTIMEAEKARGRFVEWEEITLPGDERTAQSLYQDFLFKLVQDCHVEEAVVEPLRTQMGKYFTRIPFTVSGKITLANLTELLYRFYEPNLLHQIRGLDIDGPRSSSSKLLQVKLSIEGLVLHNAQHRGELLREGQEIGGPLLAGTARKDFAIIAQKNIFEPYREPPRKERPPEPPQGPRVPEIDAARFVYFVGAPTVGEDAEAWLYDRLNNSQRTLHAGDEFDLAGIKGKLTEISEIRLAMDVNGRRWTLDLGKSLRDMQPVAGSKEAAAGNGDSTEANGSDDPQPTKEETKQAEIPNVLPEESEQSDQTTQFPQPDR